MFLIWVSIKVNQQKISAILSLAYLAFIPFDSSPTNDYLTLSKLRGTMTTHCPQCNAENLDDSKFCKECGIQLIPLSFTKTLKAPAVSTGKTIAGKYKILKEIGRGGMGVVYKAEDTRLKRTVALKFMPPELTRDPEAKERFVREVQAAAALSHPNICTIYEIDEEEGKSFISMEYIEGQSIREKVKNSALEIQEALDMAIQAAQGLEEAHKRGIIHRDIKSANIMVAEEGQVKVMDFGLAKVTGASLITREAKTMGTVAYMSPEQAEGQAVDLRTDIWSLGVVLYEMLAGRLPFRGEQEGTLLYAIVHKAPQALRTFAPKVPAEVERVVEKALAKNPADRYKSMGEFLKDLEALATGFKPRIAKRGLLRGKTLGIKRPFFFGGIAVLTVLIILGIWTFLPRGEEVLDSIAILPLVNDSGDPSQNYFADSLTDRLIAELYKVSSLHVAPRQSVMAYKNSGKSLKEIAGELGVKAVVEASVLKSGTKVRLIARLIDPKRNSLIWSDTLERDYSEILFLQSDLSKAITGGIKVAVSPEEISRLSTSRKVNPEAYDLVMQGINNLYFLIDSYPSLKDYYQKSLDYFQRAADFDPSQALAHRWIANIYWQFCVNHVMPYQDVYPKAKEAVLKALELDENLAEAHSQYAVIKSSFEWDFDGAEREFKRALELEPGNQQVQWGYAEQLAYVSGKYEEALKIIRHLMKEPSVLSQLASERYIYICLCAGRYDDAIEAAKKAGGHLLLSMAYALKGNSSEALSQLDRIKNLSEIQNHWEFLLDYACVLALSGRREEALKNMEAMRSLMSRDLIDSSFETACVYAALGDKEKAYQFLYEAYENHHTRMETLITSYWLKSLHNDLRFEDLRSKMGL
jgi:TolB-like protein/tRNA A-37 threonylcarbamoyl transferase component Bud32/Flp pilus assembly protein TadD